MLLIVSDLKRLVTFEESFESLHHQEHLFGLLAYSSPADGCYNKSWPIMRFEFCIILIFGREVGVCLYATGAEGWRFDCVLLADRITILYFNFAYFPCGSHGCLRGIKQTLALDFFCTVNLLLIGTTHTKV